MDRTQLLEALGREGDAFVEACLAAGPAAPVEHCPGWSVDDLLWHLVEVQHFWTWIVSGARPTWEGYVQPPRPDTSLLVDEYRLGLDRLRSVLAAAPPDQPNWTWSRQHDAAFVLRRMVHELVVHRCDAESAAGRSPVVAPDVASDGIDEFLVHHLGGPPSGSVHLHCTDTEGEWTLRADGVGGVEIVRSHDKGDAALRGAARDLLLVLWRRLPVSAVEAFGSSALVAEFVASVTLD